MSRNSTDFLDAIDNAASPLPEDPAVDDPNGSLEQDPYGDEQYKDDLDSQAVFSLDDMRWTNVLDAEDVAADCAEMSVYFVGHPGGFQWRLTKNVEATWNVEERGVTPWAPIGSGPFASIALARAAAESEAVEAANEPDTFDDYEERADDAEAIDEPVSLPTPAENAPMLPAAALGLLERLDEISTNAYLSARERATIVVAAAALRTGVIPAEMQADWA